MGQNQSRDKQKAIQNQPKDTGNRADIIPDATGMGPEFCKSCWFERRSLVACNNHYLCMNCLTLLLSVSERCPICKLPLPQKLKLTSSPSAPPSPSPPPYSP
ncbi:Z protein [Mammarenavirus ippyense]|uniref:RING finger protein Z n=1 Tax=Ippy mammarenavirus (isolate Rat/Central African Republic/Dak An B 188 d/1970) TaxID=3052308 RepID=Z_IPPYV|nr:Z protein [Mammarenavirus ippyense]Q27YE2.1 RecName: Full=RING finger protein Z; Short=Protein Z; AltName: Full=Zinc-binding protein [Mammarenavirus ippyense]ABC71142.1 Z protein [Mammarenavirus ippyense]